YNACLCNSISHHSRGDQSSAQRTAPALGGAVLLHVCCMLHVPMQREPSAMWMTPCRMNEATLNRPELHPGDALALLVHPRLASLSSCSSPILCLPSQAVFLLPLLLKPPYMLRERISW